MNKEKLIRTALILSVITIGYNIIEGIVSIFFGLDDDTLTLLGFGLDSFVEVMSGAGILHMILRMKRSGLQDVISGDKFERQALRITGISFYILAAGLVGGSVLQIIRHSRPSTTLAGIIISLISILSMYILMDQKLKAGRALKSNAIIADANNTKACFYLSFVLLVSSVLYEWLGIGWIDVAGSIGIAWFAFSEGREAFEKTEDGEGLSHQVGKMD